MTRPILAVVIPTRDRRDRLAETLAALDAQGFARDELEVIVVDDGSTDATPELLDAAAPEHFRLRALRQPPRGPAAARNRGVDAARAERILFLGDDTRPAPGALRAHLDAAGDREVAIQGLVDWDPERPITPVMRFLAPAGPQFYFRGLVAGEPVPYTAVLGSNLSAPARWFADQRYDETFPDAAFEDTELAYRWRRRGRRAVYAPEAVCWHRHRYETIEPFLARQTRAGRAARHAVRRHPALLYRVVVEPALYGLYAAGRALARRAAGRGREEELWDLRCRRAFLRGFLAPGAKH